VCTVKRTKWGSLAAELAMAAVVLGTVFTTPGWAAGAPGFDIDATAGAARVAVTTRA
jgi:type III secretory pathway component EscT